MLCLGALIGLMHLFPDGGARLGAGGRVLRYMGSRRREVWLWATWYSCSPGFSYISSHRWLPAAVRQRGLCMGCASVLSWSDAFTRFAIGYFVGDLVGNRALLAVRVALSI